MALELASRLGVTYVNLSDLVIGEGLYIERDVVRDTYVVDEDRLVNRIVGLLKEGDLIVDSHYGEIVPDYLVRFIFVLRLNPVSLYRKLVERGWGESKILENVEAEMLGVCTYNALSEHPVGKVCEVDVSGKETSDVVNEIVEVLNGLRECHVGVDWLSQELPEELLIKLLRRQEF